MERFTMPAGLADEICAALGVRLPADRDDVAALYVAWCGAFPFDPVAKAAAMVEGRPPPGADPVEVAQRWLRTGVGSTCWGHVAVLGAILDRAGIEVTAGLDRMITDELVDFHAFLVARIDGEVVALDPIHPSGDLLALTSGATGTHAAYGAGFEGDGDRLEHWYAQPDVANAWSGRYAVLSTTLDAADTRAFLAVSAIHSGVGRRFFQRRSPTDAFIVTRPTPDGAALATTTWRDGVASVDVIADLDQALHAVGLDAGRAVDLLVRGQLLRPGSPSPWAT